MIKRCALLLSLLAAQPVAAADGSWSGEGYNLLVSQRGWASASAVMRAPGNIPPGHVMTSVHWNYKLLATPPHGLQVALCSAGLCVPLNGGDGTTQALQGVSASNPLYLMYHLPGKGPIKPPIRVLRYQVLVNYSAHP
ncbi:flagellar protein FlhE [Affinibrenneria salicis]|uniref:Flagellar protein FlhE n=1 Tax=Affinibrenneria salicis TaxID=2590031 RepID=A0A5J5FU45_9GAMM|nr:flagellar protein FlhE [Affinibrenneria salicis]KAA8996703.1 flagellar protein FlhE [Affinibrenneria salicis]